MASNGRGLRLLKSLDWYKNTKPFYFDSSSVLNKIKLTSISEGGLQGHFKVDTSMCNCIHTLHGGYIASVIDVASFFAQLSNTNGRGSFTTSMFVSYITAAYPGEEIAVKTTTVKHGKSSVTETCLSNGKGHLVAKGISSYLAGRDEQQKTIKDVVGFDVYEN